MKRTIIFSAIIWIMMFFATQVSAQGGIDIGMVSIVNLGDGRLYHTQFMSGEPLQGTQRIIDGRKSEYKEVEFTDGLYNGQYSYYKYNKIVEEGTYAEGRKDGVFKEYYSDGETVKRSRKYKNGKLDGPDITYFTNGNRDREKWYKESKEYGPERRWDAQDGTLLWDKNYVDGKLDGEYMELIRSNVSDYIIRCTYKMGVLDGEYTETFTDGVIRAKGMYSNGQKVGEWTGNQRSLNDKGNVQTNRKR